MGKAMAAVSGKSKSRSSKAAKKAHALQGFSISKANVAVAYKVADPPQRELWQAPPAGSDDALGPEGEATPAHMRGWRFRVDLNPDEQQQGMSSRLMRNDGSSGVWRKCPTFDLASCFRQEGDLHCAAFDISNKVDVAMELGWVETHGCPTDPAYISCDLFRGVKEGDYDTPEDDASSLVSGGGWSLPPVSPAKRKAASGSVSPTRPPAKQARKAPPAPASSAASVKAEEEVSQPLLSMMPRGAPPAGEPKVDLLAVKEEREDSPPSEATVTPAAVPVAAGQPAAKPNLATLQADPWCGDASEELTSPQLGHTPIVSFSPEECKPRDSRGDESLFSEDGSDDVVHIDDEVHGDDGDGEPAF